jgi:hypothetical protein
MGSSDKESPFGPQYMVRIPIKPPHFTSSFIKKIKNEIVLHSELVQLHDAHLSEDPREGFFNIKINIRVRSFSSRVDCLIARAQLLLGDRREAGHEALRILRQLHAYS